MIFIITKIFKMIFIHKELKVLNPEPTTTRDSRVVINMKIEVID